MARGSFSGKPGRFWVVQSFVDREWRYWTGVIDRGTIDTGINNAGFTDHKLGQGGFCSGNRSSAAQFLSEHSAHFAADMLGVPNKARRVTEEVFTELCAG